MAWKEVSDKSSTQIFGLHPELVQCICDLHVTHVIYCLVQGHPNGVYRVERWMQCLPGELAYLFLAQFLCLQSFGSGLFVVEDSMIHCSVPKFQKPCVCRMWKDNSETTVVTKSYSILPNMLSSSASLQTNMEL